MAFPSFRAQATFSRAFGPGVPATTFYPVVATIPNAWVQTPHRPTRDAPGGGRDLVRLGWVVYDGSHGRVEHPHSPYLSPLELVEDAVSVE